MNTSAPDRRTVGWAVVYGMAAIVLVGFVLTGAAIYQQSRANGRTAERIEDCIDPSGACAHQADQTRKDFAQVLDEQRHEDLAALAVCMRQHPNGGMRVMSFCIERKEIP